MAFTINVFYESQRGYLERARGLVSKPSRPSLKLQRKVTKAEIPESSGGQLFQHSLAYSSRGVLHMNRPEMSRTLTHFPKVFKRNF